MPTFITGWKRTTFIALQNTIVPRIKRYSQNQREDTIREVENFLETKSNFVKFQISLFLFLIQFCSHVKYFRPMHLLSETEATCLLDSFCNSGIPIFRKGFWGISTLAKLSIYSITYIQKDLGYIQPSIEEMKLLRKKL